MAHSGRYDVAIVGGGIVGCATARELCSDHDVIVLEKDHIAASASGTAAGFISDYWFFTDYHVIPGATGSLTEFFRELDGTAGFEFHARPYLRFQHDEEVAAEIMDQARRLPREITYLDTDEIKERWPGAFEDLSEQAGAVVDEEAGYVNPHAYTTAVRDDAERRGADIETGTAVTEILTEGGRATGVRTDAGETVRAEHVVCAAGAETQALVAEFVDLPTRTLTYTNMRFRTGCDAREVFPMGTIVHPADDPVYNEVYFRPDAGGDIVVAGGDFWVPSEYDTPGLIPAWWKRHAREVLSDVLAGTEDLEYVSGSEHGCPKGVNVTSDNLPIIDTLAEPSNVVVVDGNFAALSMAPAYKEAIRSLITGEDCPFPLDVVGLDRPLERDFDLEWANDYLLQDAAR